MSTILVWVLITVGGYGGSEVTYSPPVADIESCKRMQEVVKDWTRHSRCVQVVSNK